MSKASRTDFQRSIEPQPETAAVAPGRLQDVASPVRRTRKTKKANVALQTRRISVRLPALLLEQVELLATSRDEKLSDTIRYVIASGVASEVRQTGLKKPAPAIEPKLSMAGQSSG